MALKAKITGLEKLQAKLRRLKRPVTRKEADQIGTQAVAIMRDLVSKGISPVKGPGLGTKFPAYKWSKASKKERADKYPYAVMKRYPDKKVTPVNLRLTGKQMASLNYDVLENPKGFAVSIGYDDTLSIKKESGHREGVGGQPSRPTIPVVPSGEEFAQKIQQAYLRVLNAAVKSVIDA